MKTLHEYENIRNIQELTENQCPNMSVHESKNYSEKSCYRACAISCNFYINLI